MMIKTYSELIRLKTFEERFEYLRTFSKVSDVTFGSKRYLNQVYYRSKEWFELRDYVIVRDGACDLAVRTPDDRYLLNSGIVIHHINPLTEYDIINHTKFLNDPNYLITTYDLTHKAIHYGNLETLRPVRIVERLPNDTCPWRN
jgi:hypothetical protein